MTGSVPSSHLPLRPLVTLWNSGGIRIDHAPGQGTDLVISFASIGKRRGEMPPNEFVGTATGTAGRPALFVSDIQRRWANTGAFGDALSAALSQVRSRQHIERITTLGLSMGGFCAIAAARVIPVDCAIAISAQFSIAREIVPEERRWGFWTRRIRRFEVPSVTEALDHLPHLYALHGMIDDLPQAERFPIRRGVDHFLFPEMTHSALGAHLKSVGVLAALVDAAVAGDRQTVARQIRRAGGGFRAAFLTDKTG
jgi:pimeloyl-ACP methyl ester carboxylesterase